MKPTSRQTYEERIEAVRLYLRDHLDDNPTLEELARVAHFSPYHFHRVFVGMTGETVAAHSRRLRLERAAFHLKNNDWGVTRIAFQAGFEAHESFTRAFRGHFGMSPSAYRKAHAEAVERPRTDAPHSSNELLEAAAGDDSCRDNHRDEVSEDEALRFLEYLKEKEDQMNIHTKKIEPMRVAYLHHVGPYNEVGPVWGRLCGVLGPMGMLGPQTRMFGLSYDDPAVTPPDKIRYDACATVPESFQPTGGVLVQETPGGLFAVATHKGPYENLAETYAAICGQWAPKSGYELRSAACMEFYLNDPGSTPPEELLTEVCCPLEDRVLV